VVPLKLGSLPLLFSLSLSLSPSLSGSFSNIIWTTGSVLVQNYNWVQQENLSPRYGFHFWSIMVGDETSVSSRQISPRGTSSCHPPTRQVTHISRNETWLPNQESNCVLYTQHSLHHENFHSVQNQILSNYSRLSWTWYDTKVQGEMVPLGDD
jgi:hypothetical protein